MTKKLRLAFIFCICIVAVVFGGCNRLIVPPPDLKRQEAYPTKPIQIVVYYNPGGSMDTLARLLEKISYKYIDQPLIIVNKPGGGGLLGLNEIVTSQPDGYTIGIGGPELLLQPMFSKLRYHYPTALEPLAQIASAPLVVAVNADQPWKTLGDLVDYAKRHPGEIKAGNPGVGTPVHIVNAAFSKLAGIEIEHVPFHSANDATNALVGGHIQMTCATPLMFKEQVKTGRLRALAIAGDKRSDDPVYANVPTMKEQGIDLTFDFWFGVISPKVLPNEVKDKLQVILKEMAMDPEFREIVEKIGLQPDYLNSDEFLDHWAADQKQLRKMVTDTGILEQLRQEKNAK